MKKFKSKVGYEILIPVLTLMIGTLLFSVFKNPSSTLSMAVIMIPTIAFVIYIFFNTTYTIDGRQLYIKCGFLYNTTINILEITSIRRTRNPISSPAASLDRLEVKHGKWGSVIVSPKDKLGFVEELLSINPSIRHDLKQPARN